MSLIKSQLSETELDQSWVLSIGGFLAIDVTWSGAALLPLGLTET